MLQTLAAHATGLSLCSQSDVADHIHTLRKVIRQTQALVRLLAPGLMGDRAAKQPLQKLAAVARMLSLPRDAEVLPHAWAALPLPVQQATPTIGMTLVLARATVAADPKTLADLHKAGVATAHLIRKFAQNLPTLLPDPVLGEGLRGALHRVLVIHKQARKRPKQQAVHDLRKACKDIRHQLEWMGADAALPGYLDLVDSIKALGAVTDLFALDRWLGQAGRACPADERAILRAALDKLVCKSTGKQIVRCDDWMVAKPKKMAKNWLQSLDR